MRLYHIKAAAQPIEMMNEIVYICFISRYCNNNNYVRSDVFLLWLQAHSQHSSLSQRRGPKREVFFLNLEDGYFGCQVNESTDYLQLFELSRICDGQSDCFMGSDEKSKELKCTGK